MVKSTNRLRNKLLLTYIPIVVIVFVVLSLYNNNTIKARLNKDYLEARSLSESHIIDTISLIDSGYRMLEINLENELRSKAGLFLEAYEQANGDVNQIDYKALKQASGNTYDFIVIDTNTTIIQSTEPLALGFNFNAFDPELGEKINAIRLGNEIWFEQIRTNVGTGKLSKFAYIPTDDKKVLLEIGYSIEGFNALIEEMKPHQYINTLLEENPAVENIRIFDTYGYQMVDTGENYEPTEESIAVVKQMKRTNILEVPVNDDITKRYIKVELNQKRERTLANTDRIIEISYSKALINQQLERLRNVSAGINILAIAGLSWSIVMMTGRITQPLETLKNVTDEIAAGNYNLVVTVDTKDEIAELADSFNQMIKDLNTSFKENERQKRELENYSKNLEELVHERTREIAEQKRILERIAMLDSLTEIPNRRSFTERFEYEWQRAKREHKNVTLMICDVDWFKYYNDHYGHDKGDVVLKEVARVLKESVNRSSDFVARIGGEEFAVILPNTEKENARTLAHKIAKAVHDLEIEHAHSTTSEFLTISIGGATLIPEKDQNHSAFFKMADEMLYEAKRTGKNKVVWMDEEYLIF